MAAKSASRRTVFLGVGAIASAALLPSLAGASPAETTRGRTVRKNIDQLSAAELETYEHAVQLLLAEARSNSGQIALHPLLRQAAMTDSQDAGRQWHQHHLRAIEARLRTTDPARTGEIIVPYWDFTQAASGQNYPAAFERAGSPLFAGLRDNGQTHLDPVFWSYHAYIDTVRQEWDSMNAPLPTGTTAHLWIGTKTVEIRARRSTTV